MRKNNWIKGAILLGFSFFISAFLVKPIGVSTQFSVLSGIIQNSIDKDIITPAPEREYKYKSSIAYYDEDGGYLANKIKNPINYDFIFVLSIPLGGFVGYKVFKKNVQKNKINRTRDIESCTVDDDRKGFFKRYLPSFFGGYLLLFGARMADGCTSGHMMSGMMQSSVSGYVFACSVFLTAIPTAIIIKKYKNSSYYKLYMQ